MLFGILALGLYFCHLVAFAAYCVAVGGYELGRAVRAGGKAWRRTALDWGVAAAQAIPALVVNIMVPLDTGVVGSVVTSYGTLSDRLLAVQSPLLFWGGWADTLSEIFVSAVIAYCVLSKGVRLAPDIWPAALAVAAASMAMPNVLLGIYVLDIRLPIMVVMLLIGATSTTPQLGIGSGRAILGGFVILTLARSVAIAAPMQAMDRQIAALRALVAPIPRGMRVLVIHGAVNEGSSSSVTSRAMGHAGMVALIDRDAFIPDLFTSLGTVHVTPPMRALASTNGYGLGVAELVQGFGRHDDPKVEVVDGYGGRVFWLGWEHKFDYLLVIHVGSGIANLPGPLRLDGHNSTGDLYRIIPKE